MRATTDDPRTPEPGAEPQPGEQEFLQANEHVPDEISSDPVKEFEVQPANGPVAAAAAQTWTPEEVATYFAGLFTILSFPLTRPFTGFGGEHWSIPTEKTLVLGKAFTPIFIKHIPYSRKPGMIADLFMWLPAIGALKTVCTEPIKAELQLRAQERQAAIAAAKRARETNGQAPHSMTVPSTMVNTGTETSPGLSV